jgi:hypothetical protein
VFPECTLKTVVNQWTETNEQQALAALKAVDGVVAQQQQG